MERSVSSFPFSQYRLLREPLRILEQRNSEVYRTDLCMAVVLRELDAALIASCVFCVNFLGSITAICLHTLVFGLRINSCRGHLYSG